MLVATFAPTSGRAGRRITREGNIFTLEGHGPITAKEIMEYDGQGHLVWATEGTRAWIGSIAAPPQSRRVPGSVPVSAAVRDRLSKARDRLGEGNFAKAVAELWYVEAAVRGGEYGAAKELADLAAELQQKTQRGLREECDDLLERAQSVLKSSASAPRIDPLTVSFSHAWFLGVEPRLQAGSGHRRGGVLWFTPHWIGMGNEAGRLRADAGVKMSAVTDVEVAAKQVKRTGGDVVASLALGGVIGVAMTGGLNLNGTGVVVRTRDGSAMHFEIVEHKQTQVHSPFRGADRRPQEVRTAVAPLLQSVGVLLHDHSVNGAASRTTPPVPGRSEPGLPAAANPDASKDEGSVEDPHAKPDLSGALARLADLHEQGALSDAEFAAAKARLLG